jgi:hypothetical protein
MGCRNCNKEKNSISNKKITLTNVKWGFLNKILSFVVRLIAFLFGASLMIIALPFIILFMFNFIVIKNKIKFLRFDIFNKILL